MKTLLTMIALAMLSSCAYNDKIRPDHGMLWSYNTVPIAENSYRITVRDSRFASSNDVEELFRRAVKSAAQLYNCKTYRISNYSTYLENAAITGTIPIIVGDIVCNEKS